MSSIQSAPPTLPVPLLRPALPLQHLPRPRLVERIVERRRRLVLLCAPAGYGKTVLMTESLDRMEASQPLWLHLQGRSLDEREFLQRLATGLDIPAGELASLETLLAMLGKRSLRLVLDDYPVVSEPGLDALLDRLLSYPSLQLELFVTCRRRPAWNLPQLLLAGELLEFDARQLAFSEDEQRRLVTQLQPRLPASRVASLWQASRGWCAATVLGLTDADSASAFHGAWFRDYLERECLASLSPPERAALIDLAQLPRFSAALCAQIWETEVDEGWFERLCHIHPLLVPCEGDPGWYCMLPAVSAVLQGRAQGASLNRLRLRACRAYHGLGRINEAVDLALDADLPEVAASYLEQLDLDWLISERNLAILLAWKERLPADLLNATPRLLCLCARALLFAWRLEEAERCIADIARFLPQPSARRQRRLLANLQALCGALHGMRGDGDTARNNCEAAISDLPDSDWRSSAFCRQTLARVAMATGDLMEAERQLQRALELARRSGCTLSEVMLDIDRIRLLMLCGEVGPASTLLEARLAEVENQVRQNHLLNGRLLLMRAEQQLMRGESEAAEHDLRLGLDLARAVADPLVLHGLVCLAELASRRNQVDKAKRHLEEAERLMQRGRVPAHAFEPLLAWQRARLFARCGHWEHAQTIAQDLAQSFAGNCLPPLSSPLLPLRNRLLLALAGHHLGQGGQAEARLQALLEDCRAHGLAILGCETQLALALVSRTLGRAEAPGLELQGRSFAAEYGLQLLLEDWPVTCSLPTRAVLPANDADKDRQELTMREMSVLQLLAEGHSNQEIGDYLFISLNTVKTHIRKIGDKLGVKRRTQAVARAKLLGLLV